MNKGVLWLSVFGFIISNFLYLYELIDISRTLGGISLIIMIFGLIMQRPNGEYE